MKSAIPEALLEMHYFHVVRDHFAGLLGRDDFHIFKPSTRVENWYGFDQGYFAGTETTEEISGSIRRYIHQNYRTTRFQLRAYFLQFKVVEKLVRRSSAAPQGWSTPYYRSELSLDPKKETGMSQHETLMRAASIVGAASSYVCPMIFSEDDVKVDARFSDLSFVDIQSAPSGWVTNEKHHICFQNPGDSPIWHSDPVPGKLIEFDELFRLAKPFGINGFERFLSEVRAIFKADILKGSEVNPLPPCMIVIATPAED